ncbi:hypothetical protein OG21DRAFT_1426718, partial [Imleria badia]
IDGVCILATSVDVEHLFSRGRNVLSHIHNHLSSQCVCALLCLGLWSSLGLVKDVDIKKVAVMDDVNGGDVMLPNGWDAIDE